MFQSFFTGLSGMFNFSRNLDNVSNNIANLNTPGYRGSDTFLRSVNGGNNQGIGTSVQGTSIRLNSGEVRQTGNDTDVAITGKGLFVLRSDSGELLYTRGGQFEFNSDFVLVDSVSGFEVMGINENNVLETISIQESRVLPAVPTANVEFSGNLSSTDTDFQVTPVTVTDASGATHDLTLDFVNPADTTDAWTVQVSDADGNELGTGEIRFDTSGSPLENFNEFSVDFEFSGETQSITFNFGTPGSFSSTTQFSGGSSTVGATNIDGNGVLGLSRVQFDEDGVMNLTYSDGDENEGQQLALALFPNEGDLILRTGSIYQESGSARAEIGRANERGLGQVRGSSVELSNVDLTQEFADLLIVQRGFQASSRVMSVSNELIEELYNSTRR